MERAEINKVSLLDYHGIITEYLDSGPYRLKIDGVDVNECSIEEGNNLPSSVKVDTNLKYIKLSLANSDTMLFLILLAKELQSRYNWNILISDRCLYIGFKHHWGLDKLNKNNFWLYLNSSVLCGGVCGVCGVWEVWWW